MDDNKKTNGLQPEEDNVQEAAADVAQNNEQSDDGVLITPENEDIKEPEMCILCGERLADKSFGEDYDLCATCRESLIRSPIRFGGFFAVLVCFCIGVWGLMFVDGQMTTLTSLSEAERYAEENKLYSAINCYEGSGNIGWKGAKNKAELYYKYPYPNGFLATVEGYFYDETTLEEGQQLTFDMKAGKVNINLPWNKDIKQMQAAYNEFVAAQEKYYPIISDYLQQFDSGAITADKIPVDSLVAKLEAEKANAKSNIEKATILYLQTYISSFSEKPDYQKQYDYFVEAKGLAPELTWFYYDHNLADLCIALGKYDEAMQYCQAIEAANAEDANVKQFYAQINKKKGDYQAALDMVTESLATTDINDTYYYSYSYEAATLCVLMGNFEKAYEHSSVAYTYGQYYYVEEIVNLHALICKKLGKEEEYNKVLEYFKEVEMEISPTVEQFIKGEVTAEEIFIEREVPFE